MTNRSPKACASSSVGRSRCGAGGCRCSSGSSRTWRASVGMVSSQPGLIRSGSERRSPSGCTVPRDASKIRSYAVGSPRRFSAISESVSPGCTTYRSPSAGSWRVGMRRMVPGVMKSGWPCSTASFRATISSYRRPSPSCCWAIFQRLSPRFTVYAVVGVSSAVARSGGESGLWAGAVCGARGGASGTSAIGVAAAAGSVETL